jgi:endonuclease III
MKHGTAYAKRLKRFYGRIKKVECPPALAEPTDPLEQLVLSIVGLETSRAQARRALDKMLASMVDFNEIRVSPPRQVAELIRPYVPNSLTCATKLCGILNAVFASLNTLRLDSLRTLGKREAKHRLEKLDRMEPYCVASVLLWSLGGHAMPVNAKMLEALRREEVVDPHASVAEVQSFLERHISPGDAKVFSLSLEHFAAQSPASKAKPRPARSAAGGSAKAGGRNRRSPVAAGGKITPRH